MTIKTFVEHYQDQIAGVLSFCDRALITGTLPEICHTEAMGVFLSTRGIRLFDYPRWSEPLMDDSRLFLTIARGEWTITGFRAADLRTPAPNQSTSRSFYLLKRLRTHALIKKAGHHCKYYLTQLGRRVLATAPDIREFVVIPTQCSATD